MAIASKSRGGPKVVRASAVLLAAGAYDVEATSVLLDVRNSAQIELFVDYTRGGAGGAFQYRLVCYQDDPAPALGYDRTVTDAPLAATAGSLNQFSVQYKQTALTAGLEKRSSGPLDVSTCAYVRVLFAEVGNVGAPGTLAATCVTGL